MEDLAKAVLELSKRCTTKYVTSSGMLTSKPCYLFSAVVTPDAPGDGSIAYLRNGETGLAGIVFNFQGQYAHPTHSGPIPVYFNKGLYVELSTNAKGVTIQYLIDPDV